MVPNAQYVISQYSVTCLAVRNHLHKKPSDQQKNKFFRNQWPTELVTEFQATGKPQRDLRCGFTTFVAGTDILPYLPKHRAPLSWCLLLKTYLMYKQTTVTIKLHNGNKAKPKKPEVHQPQLRPNFGRPRYKNHLCSTFHAFFHSQVYIIDTPRH